MRRTITILGATGSIGRSTADVVAADADRFAVAAVVGGRDGTPPVIRAEGRGPINSPAAAVAQVLAALREQGAEALLHSGHLATDVNAV